MRNRVLISLAVMAMLSSREVMIQAPKPYEPEIQAWTPRKGNGNQNGKRKRNPDRWR